MTKPETYKILAVDFDPMHDDPETPENVVGLIIAADGFEASAGMTAEIHREYGRLNTDTPKPTKQEAELLKRIKERWERLERDPLYWEAYKESVEADVRSLAAERDELRRYRASVDCRYTLGDVADVSGSHCPLDKPCLRCERDHALAEVSRLREVPEDGATIKCQRCGGYGYLIEGIEPDAKRNTCPKCEGTGREAAPPEMLALSRRVAELEEQADRDKRSIEATYTCQRELKTHIRTLERQLAAADEIIERCEWTGNPGVIGHYCPLCREGINSTHKPDCKLATYREGRE